MWEYVFCLGNDHTLCYDGVTPDLCTEWAVPRKFADLWGLDIDPDEYASGGRICLLL